MAQLPGFYPTTCLVSCFQEKQKIETNKKNKTKTNPTNQKNPKNPLEMAQDLLRSDLMFEGTEKNLTIYAGQTLSKARGEISASEPQFFWPEITGSLSVTSQGSKLSALALLSLCCWNLSQDFCFLLEKKNGIIFPHRRGNCIPLSMPSLGFLCVAAPEKQLQGSAQQGSAPECSREDLLDPWPCSVQRHSPSGLNVLVLPSPAPPGPG